MRAGPVVSVLLAGVACGPTVDRVDVLDASPPDARIITWPDGGTAGPTGATVSGRVWAPGLAPGMAPAGEEMPVSGATVYLATEPPPPIPQHAYCDRCIDMPAGAVSSKSDGGFVLPDVQPGRYWLVVQKGQFRIQREVAVTSDTSLVIPHAETTLPSKHAPEVGAWIPRIALAMGSHDPVEDILVDLGMGATDSWGAFVGTDGDFDAYNNGSHRPFDSKGSLESLLSDVELLKTYHVLMVPCTQDGLVLDLVDQNLLRNLREFVNAGGKIFVTDWSAGVADNPFPPQLTLGGTADTVGTYDPIFLTGTIGVRGETADYRWDSTDAEAVDPSLRAWLATQRVPSSSDIEPSPIDPGRFVVTGNWNWIDRVNRVLLGQDSRRQPVYDLPRVLVAGSTPYTPGGEKHPLSVSFEPTGCGRVVYSSYQTSTGGSNGLDVQERVLVYLLLEVAICSRQPPVD